MFPGGPGQDQIIGNSLTGSGTLLTVPAGHTLTANVYLTASVAADATSSPVVTVQGNGAAPAAGTIIARLVVTGATAAPTADSSAFEILVKAPTGNDITLEFTAGSSGSSAATITGWVFV